MNRIVFGCSFACSLLLSASAQQLPIYTVTGYAGHGSADATGAAAQFFSPQGVAFDTAGNAYVADTANNTVRKIAPGGVVTTLAGLAGVGGSADGTNGAARFRQPAGVAVDSFGNVYVADSGNDTIRIISPAGLVSTLAGLAGVSGSANGTGTNAQFSQPQALAVDSAFNVYVADYGNHTIREIAPGGAVSTLAGYPGNFGSANGQGTNAQFYQPEGVAVDGSFNVYVADTANGTIRVINSGGAVSTLAGLAGNLGHADGQGTNAQFYAPQGVAVDSAGNVYVTDTFNNTIRMVTGGGQVSTLAGLAGASGSSDGSNSLARFWAPAGMAAMGTSTVTLYVTDTGNGTIRQVTVTGTNGLVSTVAGSASSGSVDGVGACARLSGPSALTADSSGNVYVADTANSTVRVLSSGGAMSTLAGLAGSFGSADGTGGAAQFEGPHGLAFSGGTIYVADTGNGTIRTVTTSGQVVTLAGSAGNFGTVDGTGTAARFYGPQAMASDGAGSVYVADTWNNTIRKVTSGGVVTTMAGLAGTKGGTDGTNNGALFNWPMGVAWGGSSTLYVSDTFNHTVREVAQVGTNWVVNTIAGLAGVWGSVNGTNGTARFFEPEGIVVDGSGNLYVMDAGNNTIRKLTPVGTNWVVSTVAGMAGSFGSSDGTGTNAAFNSPAGVALDGSGNLYVADSINNAIRADITLTASLQYSVSAGQFILAWPASAAGYVLQTSSILSSAAVWTPVTTGITTSGSSYVFSNAMTAPVAFYRLEK
jgi:sugar lactone lactonase YvrE